MVGLCILLAAVSPIWKHLYSHEGHSAQCSLFITSIKWQICAFLICAFSFGINVHGKYTLFAMNQCTQFIQLKQFASHLYSVVGHSVPTIHLPGSNTSCVYLYFVPVYEKYTRKNQCTQFIQLKQFADHLYSAVGHSVPTTHCQPNGSILLSWQARLARQCNALTYTAMH